MPTQFEFIFAEGSDKPKGADRSLIRRRGMQGKNRQDGSRRSLKRKKQLATTSTQMMHYTGVPQPPLISLFPLPFPGISDAEQRQSHSLLYKAMTSHAIHFNMSPLMHYVDFSLLQPEDFSRVSTNTTFLSAVLFSSSAIDDLMNPSLQQLSQESSLHLSRTLSALNAQLNAKDAHCIDSTILVAIMLAIIAVAFGDWRTAGTHIAGLRRVVKLCGGLAWLRKSAKLHYKIERLDLAWSLNTGNQPCFQPDLISWDPVFRMRPLLHNSSVKLRAVNGVVSERVAVVYQDLQYLCVTMNENGRTCVRWKGDAFQMIMSSIQTRLLYLLFNAEIRERLEEFLCLGMLCLLTTAFMIPGRQIVYAYVAEQVRISCRRMVDQENSGHDIEAIELWVLMMSAISIFEAREEPWLIERLHVLIDKRDMDWLQVQRQLRSVMWIECIHDRAGKDVFEMLAILREKM